MNPSASGWIKKHLPVFDHEIKFQNYQEELFYYKLKETGFIYANSLSTITYPEGTIYKLTTPEISKVNLFDSLGQAYFKLYPDAEHKDFIKSAIAFYNYLKKNSWFDFKIPFLHSSPDTQLEKILENRIQTNQTIFQKSFSSLVANALLYLDVLIFEHFLKTKGNPLPYAKSLEALIANTIYLAIRQKTNKDDQDQLILKMLDVSIRYNTSEDINFEYEELNYKKHQQRIECSYTLDLACMTTYADSILEDSEKEFINQLGRELGFNQDKIDRSINNAKSFIEDNAERIAFLDTSNPFKNLYDNTHETVKTLIIRNKKRLIQELRQSKELVVLIKKSQSESLNAEEKKKVRTQLIDICKVIPSLGIFILPGGSILLPILTKFIPDLLPSAFTDNK